MKIDEDILMEASGTAISAQKSAVSIKNILSRHVIIPNEQLPNGGRMYFGKNLDFSKFNELAVNTEKGFSEIAEKIVALINQIRLIEKEMSSTQITDQSSLFDEGYIDEKTKESVNKIQDKYSKNDSVTIENQQGELTQHRYSTYTGEDISFTATALEATGNVAVGFMGVPAGIVTGTVDFITKSVTFGFSGTNLKEKNKEQMEELADLTYRSYLREHGSVNMDDYKNIQEFSGAFLWVPAYAEAIGLDVPISELNLDFVLEKYVTILDHMDKLGNVIDGGDEFDAAGYAADAMKILNATSTNPPIAVPRT